MNKEVREWAKLMYETKQFVADLPERGQRAKKKKKKPKKK